MPVPFGFGISDFVAVGQLAWRVYLSYKAAPGVFEKISMELESLVCVLDEAAETQLSHPLTPQREARLNTILAGFNSVLHDLQYVVQQYQTLGTNDRNAWDQLKFGNEDIAEIRSRLIMNMTFLTTFRSIVIGTTLSKREYGSWQWVVELPGPEGQESPTASTAPSILDNSFSRSGTGATTLVDVQPIGLSPPPQPRSRPWLASFATGSSNRRKRLISAIDKKNLDKALEILNHESATDVLDQELLDQALWSAARFLLMPLMETLVERGANVDAVHKEKNVLWNAVSANNEDAVRFLLSKKVNLNIDHLSHNALPLRAALRSDSMMSLLAQNGAPLNAEYQVSAVLRLNILQEAVSQGRESIVQILLDNGAKVDACSSSRGTALMIALSIGREAIAKRLIQKGANVNFTRSASEVCSYTNPVEAVIRGRTPSLLELLFRAGAVTNMPQALRFAQTNSDYPINPSMASQYDNDCDGTRRFHKVMIMLAQRDLRYVCYFSKSDRVEVKMQGIWKMMNELSS
ncbi:hypothetical protein JMJ35_008005 [Cladonia borealis]|uniref:Ankyrin n=1 Tax=Cladonia borealis TaxID=184061 RepID=A0AA39QWB4_9LECA|nr:hypothetical protein JMJ35_008005 [Cladonia borealis]